LLVIVFLHTQLWHIIHILSIPKVQVESPIIPSASRRVVALWVMWL
jgi:hypothetical protein